MRTSKNCLAITVGGTTMLTGQRPLDRSLLIEPGRNELEPRWATETVCGDNDQQILKHL